MATCTAAQRTQQMASLEGAVGVHGGTSTAESGEEALICFRTELFVEESEEHEVTGFEESYDEAARTDK